MGDPLHEEFILSATRLRASMYGLHYDPTVHTRLWLSQTLAGCRVPDFHPVEGVIIHTSDKEMEEAKAAAAAGGGLDSAWGDASKIADSLISQIPSPASLAGFRCTPVEFEKDDDLHVTLITAASNLRARNYRIGERNKHESKGIAGKIIPAIATTTALVSGLICMEMFKLHGGGGSAAASLTPFRSASLNLAIPFLGLMEPKPPLKTSFTLLPAGEWSPPQVASGLPPPVVVSEGGRRSWMWSAWDSITIQGPLTMEGFLAFVTKGLGRCPTFVNVQDFIIHSTLLKPSVRKDRAQKLLSAVFAAVSKQELPAHLSTLLITIAVPPEPDEKGELVEVMFPEIRYVLGPGERGGGAGGLPSGLEDVKPTAITAALLASDY